MPSSRKCWVHWVLALWSGPDQPTRRQKMRPARFAVRLVRKRVLHRCRSSLPIRLFACVYSLVIGNSLATYRKTEPGPELRS